jgi:hypothetical protein
MALSAGSSHLGLLFIIAFAIFFQSPGCLDIALFLPVSTHTSGVGAAGGAICCTATESKFAALLSLLAVAHFFSAFLPLHYMSTLLIVSSAESTAGLSKIWGLSATVEVRLTAMSTWTCLSVCMVLPVSIEGISTQSEPRIASV